MKILALDDERTALTVLQKAISVAIDAVNSVAPKGYIVKPVSKSKIESVLANLHMTEKQYRC